MKKITLFLFFVFFLYNKNANGMFGFYNNNEFLRKKYLYFTVQDVFTFGPKEDADMALAIESIKREKCFLWTFLMNKQWYYYTLSDLGCRHTKNGALPSDIDAALNRGYCSDACEDKWKELKQQADL